MIEGNWQEWLFVAGYVGFLVAIAVLVLSDRSGS
jgi:hypothetical protein